jgi:hypothetical protein
MDFGKHSAVQALLTLFLSACSFQVVQETAKALMRMYQKGGDSMSSALRWVQLKVPQGTQPHKAHSSSARNWHN